MDLLLQYKWAILLWLEVMAWSATILMLYARYKLRSQLLFKICTVVSLVTGVLPQVLLGLLNYLNLGEIDLFTVVIIALIIYGLTLGKKHVLAIDKWAERRFSPGK